MVNLPVDLSAPPLVLAWHHTRQFWMGTGAVIRLHPWALLLCGAVPAAARGYMLLQDRWLGAAGRAALELLVTVWRVVLCAVAVWAASSGREWKQLRASMSRMAAWQVGLDHIGWNLAHHLRMLAWELLFFGAALGVVYLLLRGLARVTARDAEGASAMMRQRVTISVLGNLILIPVAAIYVVEMIRPTFQ